MEGYWNPSNISGSDEKGPDPTVSGSATLIPELKYKKLFSVWLTRIEGGAIGARCARKDSAASRSWMSTCLSTPPAAWTAASTLHTPPY